MACASTEVRCELGGEPLCYPHDDDFELAFREIILSWSLTDKLFRIENWNFGVRTRLGVGEIRLAEVFRALLFLRHMSSEKNFPTDFPKSQDVIRCSGHKAYQLY